jgi:hypothetical protein
MTIEYDVTKDDIAAFNHYHLRNSATARRQYLRGWLVPPAVWLGIFLVIWQLADSQRGTPLKTLRDLLPLVIFVPFYMIYFPYAHRRTIQRTIEGMTSEGKNRGMLGRHRLTLKPEGLTEATEVSENTTAWSGVERISVSEEHAFIYVNALAAITVPRRAFPSETEFNAFVSAATDLRAKATPPPLP